MKSPLRAEVRLSISEVDPALFIGFDVYDDHGNVIGKRPEEEIEAERLSYEGKTRFRVLCVVDDKVQIGMESWVCAPNERRHSLSCVLDMAMHALLAEEGPLK